jgi:hypothetical protein
MRSGNDKDIFRGNIQKSLMAKKWREAKSEHSHFRRESERKSTTCPSSRENRWGPFSISFPQISSCILETVGRAHRSDPSHPN